MKPYMKFPWMIVILFLISCSTADQTPISTIPIQPTFTPAFPTKTATHILPSSPGEQTKAAKNTAYEEERLKMVADTIVQRGITNPDVIRAMETVPRHMFVPEEFINYAYTDQPLPIGYGQTISQPLMVALMTQLLELEPGDKILEIGTGSGYQAAVLAELGSVEVYSIEIVPELAERAKETLLEAGYDTIFLKEGDGYYGWEEYAPFDAIIVTAAPDHLPVPLVDQLAEDGILVIPIGPPGWYQTLWRKISVMWPLSPLLEKELHLTNLRRGTTNQAPA